MWKPGSALMFTQDINLSLVCTVASLQDGSGLFMQSLDRLVIPGFIGA